MDLLQQPWVCWLHQYLEQQPDGDEVDSGDFGAGFKMTIVTAKEVKSNEKNIHDNMRQHA